MALVGPKGAGRLIAGFSQLLGGAKRRAGNQACYNCIAGNGLQELPGIRERARACRDNFRPKVCKHLALAGSGWRTRLK
jgi:hypothetical protein